METIGWENHSWKYLSLIGDERVINLQRTKVYVFSDSVLCLGKIFEDPQSNDAWEQRLGWLKSSSKYRNFDRIDGEPMEFEWNIFPGFNTLQLSEVKSLLFRLDETPENFTGRILFMSKGWIQGNTKIGPVLEVATSYLHGKYGVEIRIWSLNRDKYSLLGQYFSWIK